MVLNSKKKMRFNEIFFVKYFKLQISILHLPHIAAKMNNALKNALIVIVSISSGGFVIYLSQMLIKLWFPLPQDVDSGNMDSMKTYILNAPAGSLALVIVSHALASFVSGWLISNFARSNLSFLTLLVGLMWTLFGVVNIVLIPHPIWFSIADTCVFLPMTILGSRISNQRK